MHQGSTERPSLAALFAVETRRVTVDWGDGHRYRFWYRPGAYSKALGQRLASLEQAGMTGEAIYLGLATLLSGWEFSDPLTRASIEQLGTVPAGQILAAILADQTTHLQAIGAQLTQTIRQMPAPSRERGR